MLEKSLRLKDRTLYYDGDSVVHNVDYLYNKILNGENLNDIFVDSITPEIKKYNTLSGTMFPLTLKGDYKSFENNWSIPDNYDSLNLRKYILTKLEQEIDCNNYTENQINERVDRVELELALWKEHNMNMLLATLIYMVETLENEGMVWGTGRGSSCCCYILYLIGLHDVDSVLYNLNIKEFFR